MFTLEQLKIFQQKLYGGIDNRVYCLAYTPSQEVYLPKKLLPSTFQVDSKIASHLSLQSPLLALGSQHKDGVLGKYAALFYVHSSNKNSNGSSTLVMQGIGFVDFQGIGKDNYLIEPSFRKMREDLNLAEEYCNECVKFILNSLRQLLLQTENYNQKSEFCSALNKLSAKEQLLELIFHVGPLFKLFGQDASMWHRMYHNIHGAFSYSMLVRDVNYLVQNTLSVGELEAEINTQVRRNMEKQNLDFYLREKINVIQNRLGGGNANAVLEQKVREVLKNYPAALDKCLNELHRFSNSSPNSPDNEFIRNYIEKVISLPWGTLEPVTGQSQAQIKRNIESSHYGMQAVKNSLLDFVSIHKRLSGKQHSFSVPTMCLVGPPGVGKTSIAKSLAKIVNKQVCHLSLAGITDQHELRGHRRTYIGSTMGCVMDAILCAKVDNPVFILDEIDKIGSAQVNNTLLELLDESQHKSFRDSFIDMGYDLSKVWFICTANDERDIPEPLLDRMYVVRVLGYTLSEKIHIADKYLIPQARQKYLITSGQFSLTKTVISKLIERHTFESGVRHLKNCIDMIMMKVSTKLLGSKALKISMSLKDIRQDLELDTIINPQPTAQLYEVGVCNGLSYYTSGLGDTLSIETVLIPNGSGEVHATGNLGKVIKESVKVAHLQSISLINNNPIFKNKQSNYEFHKHDLHVHLPEAVKKDGPSAGVAMVVAMASLWSGQPVPKHIAFSGEVSLRGYVMPVGGIREKLQGAVLRGIQTVCLPDKNLEDVLRIPEEITSKLKIHYIKHVGEACRIAFRKA